MRRVLWGKVLAAWIALWGASGALAHTPAPPPAVTAKPALSGCQTVAGSIDFDFEGASRSTCYVEDERTLSVLITPEHAPPINPSPWYAFRYKAVGEAQLTVHVRYHGARHRYAPKWRGQGDPAKLSMVVASDGNMLSITLPPGEGIVSAQPMMTAAHYQQLLNQIAAMGAGKRLTLGHSHDGRPVDAVHLGKEDAPHLVVLIGRQHPPEVTGAVAMDAFSLKIAELLRLGTIDGKRFQFLIVPLLNPDGVARGHWRANLGGVDLNRDWGPFAQPETRAVRDWLAQLPAGVKPALMLDFHSTSRNLFYVQGTEASEQGKRFLAGWLAGKEASYAGYPFLIEPRDANPGSGTTKNWFNKNYDIPAYTYEVGDETDLAAVRGAAEALAQTVIPALEAAAHP